MLKEMLEANGLRVVAEAEDLQGALQAYKAQKPDAVTLDLSLQSQDGMAVLKALKSLDPHAKVVVISGNSQKKTLDEAFAAGASDFLAKPIDQDHLKKAFGTE